MEECDNCSITFQLRPGNYSNKKWKGGIKRRMDPVPVDPVISVNGVNSLVKRDMQTDRINI